MTKIPTLKTARLTLRPHTMDDWPAYDALMTSPRSEFMGGPFDARAAWCVFCSDHAQWSLLGHGALAVDHEGTMVGQVAIQQPPHFPETELGWMAFEGFEGKGFMTEAAAALRLWAFRSLGLETLVSYIEPQNTRSVALAERLGAKLDPNAQPPHPDDHVYRHPVDSDGGMEAYA